MGFQSTVHQRYGRGRSHDWPEAPEVEVVDDAGNVGDGAARLYVEDQIGA